MIYTFEPIKRSRTIGGTCTRCGKKRSRTFSVTHTINPYNRNPDNTVRTREEVSACVSADLAALVSAPFVCATCARKPA
jgi:hypothetical protein